MARNPYIGIYSGIFSVEPMDAFEQGVINGKLEYATLTGNLREANSLLAGGATPSQDLLLIAVNKKWSRFSDMFLNWGVQPTALMTDISVRQDDPETLKLLLEHKGQVHDETKAWASVHASAAIKETLDSHEAEKASRDRKPKAPKPAAPSTL